MVVVGEDQLAGGVEQERPEHVEHPVEALDHGDAGEDEDRPHDQRAEDAPEQHAVLVLRRHEEVAHDQRPHEDVVDAQALLDQVARHVLAGRLRRRTTTRSRTRRPSPQPIQTADSIAASLVCTSWASLCTTSRSISSSAMMIAEQHRPVPELDVELDEVACRPRRRRTSRWRASDMPARLPAVGDGTFEPSLTAHDRDLPGSTDDRHRPRRTLDLVVRPVPDQSRPGGRRRARGRSAGRASGGPRPQAATR